MGVGVGPKCQGQSMVCGVCGVCGVERRGKGTQNVQERQKQRSEKGSREMVADSREVDVNEKRAVSVTEERSGSSVR